MRPPGIYQLYTGWQSYRFGDMFQYHTHANIQWVVNMHKTKWPQSIASQYLRSTRAESDYGVLARIIGRYPLSGPDMPRDDEVAIHLRVGDVLKEYQHGLGQWSISSLLAGTLYGGGTSGWVYHYTFPLKYCTLVQLERCA